MITDFNLSYLQASVQSVCAYTIGMYKHSHTHKYALMYLNTTFRYKRKEKYMSVYYIYIHMHICNLYIHEIVYAKSKKKDSG